MKNPSQAQQLPHSEVWGLQEVDHHYLPKQIGVGGQLFGFLSFKTDKSQIDRHPSWSLKSEQNTFFPPSPKKRLYKANAWAITFPRSVLWLSVSSQPVWGLWLHVTRAISFHSDATQVLLITVVLMHKSVAAAHDTQGDNTPCEEALEVRDCLIPKRSC